jgi:type IV pilus assembly protein PilB
MPQSGQLFLALVETICMKNAHNSLSDYLDESSEQLLPESIFSAHDLALCSTEEARALMPYERARQLRALPIALVRPEDGAPAQAVKVHCAVADDSLEAQRALRFALGRDVIVERVAPKILEEATVSAYHGSHQRLSQRLLQLVSATPAGSAHTTISTTLPPLPAVGADAAHFVSELLEFGFARGASDLHLCPTPAGGFVRVRIDGELLSQHDQPYPRTAHEQMVSRVKVLAGLDLTCKRLPQDGAFSLPIGETVHGVRVSTLPTLHGESVVLRLLNNRALPSIAALGVEPTTAELIYDTLKRPTGVVILMGPTGSGKTTTMYSMVLELLKENLNIVTVEDPVETALTGVVQVQIHERQGLDYPRAIRSVLRHDPDALLIGEMRDPVSAKIALEAGSTGHLTLSSLHANSALQVFERLQLLGISPDYASTALSLVLNQRLMPRVCAACRQRERSDGAGRCRRCGGTGWSGRVLLTETLDLRDPEVKRLCAQSPRAAALLEQIPTRAFIPWTTSLLHHLQQGQITLQQLQEFLAAEMGPLG